MATASVPFVTIDEYLHNSYDPDVDYVDGQLEERNLGEFDHGDLQAELTMLLRGRADEWSIRSVGRDSRPGVIDQVPCAGRLCDATLVASRADHQTSANALPGSPIS